jgi:hypothetical protein
VNEIPNSGTLIVSVYFDGYKPTYQNDSRRRLEELVNLICEKQGLDVTVIPLSFSLIRTVSAGITRAMGAQYYYGYSNMNGTDLKVIYQKLIEKKKPWWQEVKIMIATDVEGLE